MRTKPAQTSRMAKLRVLIVEDNSDVRRLYAIGLNQRGYEVKLAATGAEAVERIQDERPDVILLDWLMPLMDGGEVLSRIGGDAQIPIIVISGQPPPPDGQRDPRTPPPPVPQAPPRPPRPRPHPAYHRCPPKAGQSGGARGDNGADSGAVESAW